jgi:hypothetical protein
LASFSLFSENASAHASMSRRKVNLSSVSRGHHRLIHQPNKPFDSFGKFSLGSKVRTTSACSKISNSQFPLWLAMRLATFLAGGKERVDCLLDMERAVDLGEGYRLSLISQGETTS